MSNKEIHPQWMFVIVGLFVAFCVMVVLWWNEYKRSQEKTAANHELVRQGNELVKHMGVLQNENDSLYRSNDSLERANKMIKLNLPETTNIGNAGTVNIGN